jgi:catechol 2,3-dioxygenase-like lactoylglutathione lyase family enzyme
MNCRAALTAGVVSMLAAGAALAAPAGTVLAPGNFIHVVAHIDKTIAFYHGVLGLEQMPFGNAPPAPPRFMPNGPVAQLYAVPADTPVGVTVFRLPVIGVGLEFAEFRSVKQKSSRVRPQDPGASVVVLTVRQLDPILQRAHGAHVPILTTGGVPVSGGAASARERTVVLRDPDGYYVELVEHPSADSEGGGAQNVLQAGLMLSIADTDRNAQFYRDLLGLPLQIDASFSPDEALARAFGLRAAQFRHSVASVDGSNFRYDFIEWKGVLRRPSHAGVHDPGAGVIRLTVADVDGLVEHLKSDGVTVDSTGNGVVALAPMFHASILSDPNGLYIEPVPKFRPRRPAGQGPQAGNTGPRR